MSLSSPFIQRPVATTLLMIAITLAGAVAFLVLPVSSLPQIDFPTININAGLPGASPEIVASSIATPLERQLGRVAAITEMTSSSSLGRTGITIQFDLDRNIDGAARDVQAAINAAHSYLPINLPANPTWRKANPSDPDILDLVLTSNIYDRAHMYDFASTVMAQRISQIQGVGQVSVGGSSLPAVRVELNPTQVSAYGLSFQQIGNMLRAQNSNLAKGQIANDLTSADILDNDQIFQAKDYQSLVVGYHNGSAVKLSDVAQVVDSNQDLRNGGFVDGKPAVSLGIKRIPGANIIETVDRIKAAIPSINASIPSGIDVSPMQDRTIIIRAAVSNVEQTLLLTMALVIGVVFVFLKSLRATSIPAVVIPVALVGTFGIMYLCGFSLDNLSLMALTVSTGFVVDDAIVVIENITRHIENGMTAMEAAMFGATEIGPTVLSMSISLVCVFIPILLMQGIVGRLFREFALTLSAAIAVSMVLSLTATPMMCARLLKRERIEEHGWVYRANTRALQWVMNRYNGSLTWVLDHPALILGVLLAVIGTNVYLLTIVPKGFFPQQDNGFLGGGILASEDSSWQSTVKQTEQFVNIIRADPAVEHVQANTGGTNNAGINVDLKPLAERQISADQVIGRLRPKLNNIVGARAFLQANQDLRIGGRGGNSQFQYTIQGDNLEDLVRWGPILLNRMGDMPGFADANSDQHNGGLQEYLVYDRPTASRLGLTPQTIDNALYNAFGQSLASTMYRPLNQYYVVMEVAPQFWQGPESLNSIYVRGGSGAAVPLATIAHFEKRVAPLAVNHSGQFPSVTVTFNLLPGMSLSDAATEVTQMERELLMPPTIHGYFSGTMAAFQASLAAEPYLVITALFTVFIVLGILYESYIHPITILSTLPSASLGAVAALLIFKTDLNLVALIGIILLIGLVQKNAILMIDFALAATRNEGKSNREAIHQAAILRFRPILMTSLSAILGATPVALGHGVGAELRRPMGIAIVGGLIVCQLLTVYTTPIVYLYMDRFRIWWERPKSHARLVPQHGIAPGVAGD